MTTELFCYADESGIQRGAPVCLIGGYIASPSKWSGLDDEWREVLRDHKVGEFKSSRFFVRDKQGQRVGEYKGWTDEEASLYLLRLVQIILKKRITSLGWGVEREGFDALTVGERRLLTGGIFHEPARAGTGRWRKVTGAPTKPYFFLMELVIKQALLETVNRTDDVIVHFVFDQQTEFQDHAERWFRVIKESFLLPEEVNRMGELRFADSKQRPALQASDLYAGIVYRNLTNYKHFDKEHAIAVEFLAARPGVGIKRGYAFPVFGHASLVDFLNKHVPAETLQKIRALKS